ncbi:MAG: sulfatase [Verrucomicrobiota bacterium]
MNRRTFTQGLLAGTSYLASKSLLAQIGDSSPTTKKPNLLYVFPDQMRMHAMGFWKKPGFSHLLRTETDPVVTPNLDQLAEESVVFTQASSTHPLCSPHRAMLMTGMYPSRNGVEGMNCRSGRKLGIHHDITCFTDVLSENGYETAYVGKTHWERTEPLFDKEFNYVGTTEPPGGHYANEFDTYIPPGPGRHGNKFWYQHIRDEHFSALSYSNQPDLVGGKEDGQPFLQEQFAPEVEADVIVQYLENQNGEREGGKPFSIIWSPNPPHNPYFSPDDCEKDIYEKYYEDMPLADQLYRENVAEVVNESNKKYDPEKCAAVYYALVTGIDRQLGRILDALEASGEADNTIVVFTADHGEMMGSHGRMGKGVHQDESFLVPFLIRYPDKLKPSSEDLLIESVDIMPSILGMMGLGDRIPYTVDGVNYADGLMKNNFNSHPKPKSALYLSSRSKGVRTDRYTYVVHGDSGDIELIDNVEDPYQLNRLDPNDIDVADYELLKSELGMRLQRAGDAWADTKRHPELISYPG